MPEAIISTEQVRRTQDSKAVEVIATLDAGEIVPGMFVHIPLNGMLDITVRVKEIVPEGENRIRLVLNCDDDPEIADLVMATNFEDETLWALETGTD